MYSRETANRNLTRFRPFRRPALLVDHDREFGTLMRVAFESRGERLEWTDRISDALRILAGQEYDPVIIDLRLYDGSGFDLLEEAANRGLLAPDGAVILASHDLVEPRDASSSTASLNLDAFLDRLMVLGSRTRTPRDAGAARIQFILYIARPGRNPARESDAGALANVRFFLRDLSHESMVA
jgi:CheY-like chemotaxis protein